MTQAADSPTPLALIAGRHLVGMAVVALANPLIYYGGGIYQWSITFFAALFGAAVVCGIYALFFTKRAKAAWPGSFFVLAWVMLGLALVTAWMDKSPQQAPAAAAPSPWDDPQIDWERGEYTPPTKSD